MQRFDFEAEELVPIVAELAGIYTGHESTSITYERAQSLMEAVQYCIHELELSKKTEKSPMAVGRTLSAREAYQVGYQLVLDKVERLRNVYNQMMPEFCDYGLRCLRETMVDGIPEFFKWYDVKFQPQDTILTLDYPIPVDLSKLSGVDAVYAYTEYVCREQEFLRQYDSSYIVELLERYHKNYGVLVENICEMIRLAR